MPDDWVSVSPAGGNDWVPVGPAKGANPAQQAEGGVFHRLWEGVKAGWSDKQFEKPSDVPGGAVGIAGALPSRFAHDLWEGIKEGVTMPGKVWSGEQPITGTASDARLGLPTASLMVGGGMRLPAQPRSLPNMVRDLRSGIAPVLKDTGSGRAPAVPSTPLEEPSSLAGAMARGDSMAVDRQLTRDYRRAVKPGISGQQSAPKLQAQDNRILTAIDQIIANRGKLALTDDVGNEVRGQLPRNLRQFSEAIDQTKRGLFQQYDAMAKRAGDAGVRVDLAPVIERLRSIAKSPEVVDLHPNVAMDALKLAQTFMQRGSYSPAEAQDIIQNLNRTLSGFWRNPTNESVSRSTMLAPVATELRTQLDKAIENARGGGYQALRNRYGALRSIETDVARAVQRDAKNLPGGIGGIFADLGATEEIVRGILSHDPAALARAGGLKAAKWVWQYINSPNRAIGRMFERRAAPGGVRPGLPIDSRPLGLARPAIGNMAMNAPQRPDRQRRPIEIAPGQITRTQTGRQHRRGSDDDTIAPPGR